MLNITISVSAVDYDKTLASLFPLLSGRLASSESTSAVILLLRELGDAAVPVARELLRRLSAEMKAELTAAALSAAAPDIQAALNRLLAEKGLSGAVTLGAVTAQPSGAGLRLRVESVAVDYPALLRSPSLNGTLERHFGALAAVFSRVGRMAVMLSPAAVEKLLLELAMQPGNRQSLMAAGEKLLGRVGVFLTLADLQLERTAAQSAPTGAAQPFTLTPGQEQALLRAVAGYLRDTVKR